MPINEYDDILASGNTPSNGNAYFSMVDNLQEENKNALKGSMFVASKNEPERRARVLDLSQRSNIPPNVVDRNFDEISAGDPLNQTDYDKIIEQTPALSQWLKNSDNASIGQKDLDSLGRTERSVRLVLRRQDSPSPLTLPAEMSLAFRTGWSNLNSSAGHLGAVYGYANPKDAAAYAAKANKRAQELRAKMPDYAAEFNQVAQNEGGDIDRAVKRFASSYDSLKRGRIMQALIDYNLGGGMAIAETLDLINSTIIKRPRGTAYSIAENLPYSLPSLILGASGAASGTYVGAAGGAVIGGPAGAAAGAGAGGFLGFIGGSFFGSVPTEVGAWINESIQRRGFDITNADDLERAYSDPALMAEVRGEAERKGLTTAAVDAIFNAFAGRMVSKAAGGALASRTVARAADVAVQSVGETSSDLLGKVAAKKGTQGVSVGDSILEGITSLGQSVGDVAIGASLRATFPQDTSRAAEAIVLHVDKAILATHDAQAMLEVGQAVQEIKTVQKVPGKIKELIELMSPDEETSVYFQSEDWDEYWTGKGLSPVKASEQIFEDGGKAYHEAKASGSQLAVPLPDYIEKVGTSEHFNELLEVARTQPDGMSLRESREFLKSLPATMNDLAKEAAGTQEQQKTQESAAQVGQSISDQLVAAGQDPAQAAVFESTFKTMGERTGIDPLELFNRYNVRIRREEGGAGGSQLFQAAPSEQPGGEQSQEPRGAERVEEKTLTAEGPFSRAYPYTHSIGGKDFVVNTPADDLALHDSLAEKADPSDKEFRRKRSMVYHDIGGKLASDIAVGVRDGRDVSKEKEAFEEALYKMLLMIYGEAPIESTPKKYQQPKTLEQAPRVAPPFYSKLQRDIEEKLQQKSSIDQVQAILRDTKEEERKWSGIDEFLKGKTKIDKDVLLEFLRANQVEIQEVEKGDIKPAKARLDKIDARMREIEALLAARGLSIGHINGGMPGEIEIENEDGELVDELAPGSELLAGEYSDLARLKGSENIETTSTKFSAYQLPGGENYRELLLTLPYEKKGIGELREGETLIDALDRAQAANPIFKSPHFDEPNVLAHVRFNDRTDSEGKRVLFIEEIQSDWHQKGRKQGYRVGKRMKVFDRVTGNEVARFDTEKEAEEYVSENDPKNEVLALEYGEKRLDSGVPDAPFRKTWHEFALKRMIRYASENGYDKIAWTTGEQQAERYDLSKQIDGVRWNPTTEVLAAWKGGRNVIEEYNVTANNLPDFIGKDLAQKLINIGPSRTKSGFHIIEGEGIKVGGEGMKGFYDKIIPAFLNKFGKKYGARVEKIEIQDSGLVETYQPGISRKVDVAVESLPITPSLKQAALEQGFSLFQGEPESPRGRIRFGPTEINIDLLKNADPSTFFHETGHFYFKVLSDLAAQEGAPDQIKKDFQTILDWFGVKSVDEITTEHQEQWARGFEAYIFEGKAPSSALREAFARFSQWLREVYKQLTSLNVDLTDDVRSVFDRLLATDEEIAAAKEQQNIQPLFADPKAIGMTDAEAASYLKAREAAEREATEELTKKFMDQVQRKDKKEWQAQRDKIKEEVTKEVDEIPIYIAIAGLKNEAFPDAPDTDKISKRVIESLYGKEFAKTLPAGVYTLEEGLHPDTIADLYGFSSGDEMLKKMSNIPSREELIETTTDQRMVEEHGDMLVDGTLPEQAMQAVHNEKRSLLLRKELEILASENLPVLKDVLRRVSRRIPPVEAVRDQARRVIQGMKVRQINPSLYQRAEAKLSKEAVEAVLKGDFDAAFEAKKKELLNHELYRAATEAKNTVDGIVEYMKKFNKLTTREALGKAGADYLEQIDDILERFDFRRGVSLIAIDKRKSLAEWVKEQQEIGFDPVIPDKVLDDAYKQHYKDTPYEELVGISDAVKNIEHLARLKNKLLKSFRERELDAAIDEATASIEANSKGARPRNFETRLPQDELTRGLAGFLASHRKFSSYMRQMDGFKDGGVMWELFSRPMNEAATEEASKHEEAAIRVKEIFSVYSKKELLGMYRREFIPGANVSLSKMAQIMVALNWGNLDNRQKLMDGQGWDIDQVQAILSRLSEKDWNFVQNIWDFIDTYWPETKAISKRVNGIAPEKVEAAEIDTRFGRLRGVGTFKGGYFPLKYDDRQSPRVFGNLAKETAEQMMRGAFIRSTTKHGHREARVTGVKLPVRLDFGVIFDHVSEVIHDQTHYEFLVDMNRLLGNKRMQDAIISHYGDIVYGQLRAALQDIAAGGIPATNSFEKAVNWLRTGTSIAGLAWNTLTAMIQPLGLTQSIQRVGAKWVARGVSRWLGDASRMENTVKWVHGQSEFMRLRSKTQAREINEIRNSLSLRGVTLSGVENSFFWLITRGQMIADIPTWLGAYEKAIDESKKDEDITDVEARAVALADQAVVDSQGGGQIKDLAQIQRGGPLLKLWTNFYSFFNVTYNLAAESIAKTNLKSPVDVGRLAVDMMLLYTLPAILGVLLKDALRGGDDDDELAERLIREQASYILGSFVGVRELSGVVQGFRGYEGPAGTRFFSEFGKFTVQVQQGETDEAFWRALNSSAGILFHYPSAQVERTVRGYIALQDGDTNNPKALLVGPPRR